MSTFKPGTCHKSGSQVHAVKLGITSKLNRRLTARNWRFWAVAIVLNNGNRPDPAVLGGQPLVEF